MTGSTFYSKLKMTLRLIALGLTAHRMADIHVQLQVPTGAGQQITP